MPSQIGDVVVIGAGVSGIAAGKAFLQRGCRSLRILEKSMEVGGHWAWTRHPAIGCQNHRQAYRFSDMPMPGTTPRASAAEIHEYLQAYARKHGILEHIRFGTDVQEVVERSQCGGRREVVALDIVSREPIICEADVVVFAPGMAPHIPHLAGQDHFQGRLLHSAHMDEALVRETVSEQRQVLVVGGGKSASDVIATFREADHPASLVRTMHSKESTCVNFEFQLLPLVLQLPVLLLLYISTALANIGSPMLRLLADLFRSLVFLSGLLVNTPTGGGGDVVSSRTVELMKGVQSTRGRLVEFTKRGAKCSDGQELQADVIVCATGYRTKLPPIKVARPGISCPQVCDVQKEQALLYRAMVLPEMPQMAVILFNSMGVNAMISAEIMAAWLAHFYASNGSTKIDLQKEITSDARGLRERRCQPFTSWQFDRGGVDYAADFYEDQIFKDLEMRLPSRFYVPTRAQHDEAFYRYAASHLEGLGKGSTRVSVW